MLRSISAVVFRKSSVY